MNGIVIKQKIKKSVDRLDKQLDKHQTIKKIIDWFDRHIWLFIWCYVLAIIIIPFLFSLNDDSVRIVHYARVTNIGNDSLLIKFRVDNGFTSIYSEKEISVDDPSEFEIGDILAVETNRTNKFLAISNNIYNVSAAVTSVGYNGITITYTDGYGIEEKNKKIPVDDPSQCKVGDILTIKINTNDELLTVSKGENEIWTNWLIF